MLIRLSYAVRDVFIKLATRPQNDIAAELALASHFFRAIKNHSRA